MNCEEVQSLLARSDVTMSQDGVYVHFAGDAAPAIAERVAGHVNQCRECEQFARKLRRLEKAVRSLPAPDGSSESLARFEARLAAMGYLPPILPIHMQIPEDTAVGIEAVASGDSVDLDTESLSLPMNGSLNANVQDVHHRGSIPQGPMADAADSEKNIKKKK